MSDRRWTRVKDRSIEGLRGAEHRRRQPTNGRQGKRPAFGAAYVVGWIEQFAHILEASCWRFHRFVQRNQSSKRRRAAESLDFGR
ncbi:hypothetical protein [Thiobacillus sedimenti]|uniref:Uncharacterized protein n=1 Tax=Thiobacillus sedimenti TaxID=3110231 RepID=A0ABZ1CGY8_9PROT|nr:hypothetical protein [Thiobacillus sp. SCUT-2]WRS38171.1 hypothetical protein VA613_09110 [Thiobacillus sp. SCUT-2]